VSALIDGDSSLIQRGLAGLAERQGDQYFVVRRGTIGLLNACIPQPGFVDGGANCGRASGCAGEFDANHGAPAEVDVQRQMMPEQDGKEAGQR